MSLALGMGGTEFLSGLVCLFVFIIGKRNVVQRILVLLGSSNLPFSGSAVAGSLDAHCSDQCFTALFIDIFVFTILCMMKGSN